MCLMYMFTFINIYIFLLIYSMVSIFFKCNPVEWVQCAQYLKFLRKNFINNLSLIISINFTINLLTIIFFLGIVPSQTF